MINGVSMVMASLSDGLIIYLALLTTISFFCFIVFRKYLYSILDPLLLPIIAFCFQYTTLQYLFFYIEIDLKYYVYSNIAFLIFWTSFLTFAIKVERVEVGKLRSNNFSNRAAGKMFILDLILFLTATIYFVILATQYFVLGFNFGAEENFSYHRSVYLGGAFPRVLNTLGPVLQIICMYNLFIEKRVKLISVLLLLIYVVTAIPTAGKTFIYGLVVTYAMLRFSWSGLDKNVRGALLTWILFAMAFVFTLYVLSHTYQKQSIGDAIFALFYRFFMYSDILMFSFVGNALNLLDFDGPLIGLLTIFKDLIGFLRLYPWESLPPELGNRLLIEVTGEETLKGPNPTHLIFGLFYFDWAGLVFSALCGSLLGLSRGKLLIASTNGIFCFIAYYFVYRIVSAFTTDPSFAMQLTVNGIFIFLPIYFLATLVKSVVSPVK